MTQTKRIWFWSFFLFGFFGLGAVSPFANDETNRELARTFANFYLRSNDYRMAQKTLSDHLEHDPDDVSAWNLMGLAALQAGEFPQAKSAFFQASNRAKDEKKGIYLYYYADALNRGGEPEKAKDALKIAKQESLVKDSATKALKEFTTGKSLPELYLAQKGSFQKSLTVLTGYDTNVLLISNTSAASLQASNQASPFVTGILNLGYVKPILNTQYGATLTSSFQYYTNTATQTYNSAYSGIHLFRKVLVEDYSGRSLSFGTRADLTYLNLTGSLSLFNWNALPYVRLLIKTSDTSETDFEIGGAYRYFLNTTSDVLNDRSGIGVIPSITHRHAFGEVITSFGLTYEKHLAKGDNFKSDTYSIPLSVSKSLFSGIRGTLRAEPMFINYPVNAQQRRDTHIRFGTQFNKRLMESLVASLDYSFRNNASIVDAATYQKHMLSLMMSYEF